MFALPVLFPGGPSYLGPQTGWHRLSVDHRGIWVRGTPLAGTASALVSIEVMAAARRQTWRKPQIRILFTQMGKKGVIDKWHQVQC